MQENMSESEIKKNSPDNLELLSLYKQSDFKKVILIAEKIIKKEKNNFSAYNFLGLAYKAIGELARAEEVFFDIIRKDPQNPSLFAIYANTANLFYEIGQVNKSIVFYKASLELNKINIDASLGMGLALSSLGKDDAAINCYKKALEVYPGHASLSYNIAQSLRKLERFKEASEYYANSNERMSKSYKLECLYQSIDNKSDEKIFFNYLDNLNNKNYSNPLIACLSSHSSIRFSKKDNCNFCKNPFDFIEKYNLFDKNRFSENFIDELLYDINSSEITKKSQSLLKNGLQSSGNLFMLENKSIKKLKKIITENIIEYRNNLKDKNIDFYKNWPKKSTLYGWLITMESGGNLLPHMHKEGWLSSSIYLKRPKKNENHDGDIKFSLDGAGYASGDKNYPERIIDISQGDMVMFPSSLFHSTIPFSSNENRITFAFDIIPTSN
jgi:tetratricopeptide (TPR) repeat protein